MTDRTTRLVVEIDAENVREQIRASVVEILEERDRALADVDLLRSAVEDLPRILQELGAPPSPYGRIVPPATASLLLALADRVALALEETRRDQLEATPLANACACPTSAVDGHVCEPS